MKAGPTMRAALCSLILIVFCTPARAHELRPGYLEITQNAGERYEIRFKVPARGDLRLRLYLRLPDGCRDAEPPHTERAGNAFMDRHAVTCAGGLAGKSVSVDGLAATFTDVVARVQLSGGHAQTVRLTPDAPHFVVAAAPVWHETALTYFGLGVEHILLGIDHLLFVLALLLLIRVPLMLVKAITAFTAAHSLTLIAATLGWAHAPQGPVEAVIALSIAFAAAEVLRHKDAPSGLCSQAPWVAAFVFGLLHGFGFGGALREIGLPQSDVPLALLTFNLGVEAGQLLFVAAVLTLVFATRKMPRIGHLPMRRATAYAIGGVAAFWFFERVASIV